MYIHDFDLLKLFKVNGNAKLSVFGFSSIKKYNSKLNVEYAQ